MLGGLESATDFLPLKLQKAAFWYSCFPQELANSLKVIEMPLPSQVASEFLSIKLPLHPAAEPPASETELINGEAWHRAAFADVRHLSYFQIVITLPVEVDACY